MRTLWHRFLSLFRNSKLDAELEDELEAVLQMEIDANLERGLSPEEARRQARIAIGGIESTKEAHRDARGIPWLDNLWRDTILAFRSYRRSPVFTTVVLITLAIGIGFSTFVFSLIDGILLRSLPYPHPEQIVRMYRNVQNPFYMRLWAPSLYLEDQENRPRSIEAVATFVGAGYNMSGPGDPQRVHGYMATPSFFEVLEVEAYLGRTVVADDVRYHHDVAVLSYAFWQKAFSGSSSAIGREIVLNGKPFQVIGVLPPGEDFLDGNSYELWLPLDLSTRPGFWKFTGGDLLYARIRQGYSIEQAQTEADLWAERLRRAYPQVKNELRLDLEPYFEEWLAETKTHLQILVSAVALVLLLSCINVAGLLSARGSQRGREVAVRSALGAGRRRLLAQFLTESILLAVPAGILGLGLSSLVLKILKLGSAQGLPRLGHVTSGWLEILFAVALAVVSSLLVGLWPALNNSRVRPMTVLKQSGFTSVAERGRGRLNSFLVIGQVALALLLLLGAGLFLRSYWELSHVNLGFQTRNVLTARMDLTRAFPGTDRGGLPDFGDRERERIVDFTGRVLEQLRSLPGIESVGVAVAPPLGDTSIGLSGLETESPAAAEAERFAVNATAISPAVFDVLGLRLLEGRFFGPEDTRSAEPILIIDRMVASHYWPEQSPLGKRMKFGEGWRTVVGVVGEIRPYGPGRPPRPMVYFPFEQYSLLSDVTILERGKIDVEQFRRGLRRIVAGLDPNQPVYDIASLADRLSLFSSTQRLISLLLSLFGIVSLFLAAVGLYGTLAFLVSEKTHEVGVRMSLGAEPTRIFRMITSKGMGLVLAGLALGSVGGLAVNYYLAGLVSWDPDYQLLFQAKALDVSVFAGVGLLLFVIGFLACAIPALRAARLDPNRALRYE